MTRDEIIAAIEARMGDGRAFSFADLSEIARRLAGWGDLPDGKPTWRLADNAIQRWRKRGWISFVRFGRETVWSLTDAGREALASKGGGDG